MTETMTDTPTAAAALPEGALPEAAVAAAEEAREQVPAAPRNRHRHPTADEIRRAFEQGVYPYGDRLGRRTYERQKAQLQA